ncbi:MAG: hypothetical protein HYV27_08345 [Candidatus Hydrogenedentes bacterium]|nr:hypothetical protein [Candidatus Hydrogenedentota bacterium]
MGLQQKKHRMRFRVPEGIAVALGLLTVVVGLFWWSEGLDTRWKLAGTRVLELRLVEEGGAGDPQLEMVFAYMVDGVEYLGRHRLGWIERLLFGPIPEDARALLEQRGYQRFEDLPEAVRGVLAKKGISSFEHVPKPLLDSLAERGTPTTAEVPEDIKVAYRAKEYDKVAAALDQVLPNYVPFWLESVFADGEALGILQALRRQFRMNVAYDPDHPSNYRVTSLHRWTNALALIVFLGSAAATLLYSIFGYPRLKKFA